MNAIDGICSHLEFLGYTITKLENGIRAEGTATPRVLCFRETSAGILFSTTYASGEITKSDRLGYLEWLNVINQKSALITAFAEDEDRLTFAATFPKSYDKQLFGTFFRSFCADIDTSLDGKDAKTEAFLK